MAWTQKNPSGTYRGLYRDASGKTRSAGSFPLKRQAQAKAESLEGSEHTVTPTLSEWLPEWRRIRPRVEESTRINEERRIAAQIVPRWGDTLLADIGSTEIQEWLNGLTRLDGEPQSPSSVRKVRHTLSAILRQAVNKGLLDKNPVAATVAPEGQEQAPKFLPDDVVDKMLPLLQGKYRLMTEFLLDTGLRWGELTGLHWESVHDDAIIIERSYDSENQFMKSTKSYGTRAVPLTVRAKRVLADLPVSTHVPTVPYVGCRKPSSGLVFPGPSGEPLGRGDLPKVLKAAALAVGYYGQASPHVLRHTYGTRLAKQGVSLYAIQKVMGHSTQLMAAHYAKVEDSQFDAIRAALG